MQGVISQIKTSIFSLNMDVWVYQVFAIMVAALVATLFIYRIINKLLEVKSKITANPWDGALVSTLRGRVR
jgi:hypothetical protein